MNSKDHVLKLVGLERELRATSDDELTALIVKTEPNVQQYLKVLAGSPDAESVDIAALRGALSRGRMKGVPDRVAGALIDPCLQDCIEALGDKADLPSEDDLSAVLPGVVSRHGLSATRVMLSTVVLGNAPASATIAKLLKRSPILART